MAGFFLDNFSHFFSDDFYSLSVSIRGFANLIGWFLGESNDENSHDVSILGLDFTNGFD